MKWRKKILLVFLLALTLFLGLVAGLGWLVFLPQAEKEEQAAMVQDLHRFKWRVEQRLDRLRVVADDYALERATYDYAHDRNDAFAATTFTPVELGNLPTEIFGLWNEHDDLVAARGYDPALRSVRILPAGEIDSLTRTPGLWQRDPAKQAAGLALTTEGVLLLVATPVLQTDHTGPVHGTLVIGQFWRATLLRDLQADEPFEARLLEHGDEPAELAGQLTTDDGLQVGARNGDDMVGRMTLPGLNGAPLATVELHAPRLLSQQERHSLNLVLGLLAGGSLLLCAGFWTVTEWAFIGRVERLSKMVALLDKVGPIAALQDFPGDDEITQLAHSIGKMARTLHELKESAESGDRAKGEFLAMMSHEIRTPLNGVIGYLSLLRETGLAPEQVELINTIESSSDTLLAVINEILDFSKIESGQFELESLPVRVATLVSEAAAVFHPRLGQKQIAYREEFAPGVPEAVLADPLRLRQVLLNLLGNAVKFTPHGGEIVLRVTAEAGAAPDDIVLRFEIADNGIGIGPQEIGRLFQPFSQADTTITRKFGGTGLGLAICQRLVRAMDGRIDVRSELGQGSTFGFTVPTRAVAPPAAHEPPGVGRPAAAADPTWAERFPLRILVVEDNAVNRRMLEVMLKRFGYVPAFAEDGRQAVAELQSHRYDLVLMDMQMPEMDGCTATRTYRQWERAAQHRPVPIVALTANAMAGDREKCLAAGMDDYLTKPIKLDELQSILERVGGAGA